jgi:uncharacterized membrane protein YeaQ/YmgE (transglycosylase-associated protein family)
MKYSIGRLGGFSTDTLSKEVMMGFLVWIILGLVVGVIAKLIMPGKDPGGFIITIILGIAGAFVGGFIASKIGFGTVTGFDIRSLLIAVGGAVLLLVIYRVVKK